jgi:hypothetical protein
LERSFARALVCGSCSCLAPASFTGDPPLRVTRNVRFSQTYSDHRLRCRDMLVNCPDNLGQQMTVDVFELSFALRRRLALLSRAMPTADVARAMAEVLTENVTEI